jgi:hypothetical protein
MSFHAASASSLTISASRKSAGSLCTTPPGTRWLLTVARVTSHLPSSRAAGVGVVVANEPGRTWEFVTARPFISPPRRMPPPHSGVKPAKRSRMFCTCVEVGILRAC